MSMGEFYFENPSIDEFLSAQAGFCDFGGSYHYVPPPQRTPKIHRLVNGKWTETIADESSLSQLHEEMKVARRNERNRPKEKVEQRIHRLVDGEWTVQTIIHDPNLTRPQQQMESPNSGTNNDNSPSNQRKRKADSPPPRTCSKCGVSKSHLEYSNNQRRKGAAAKCKACTGHVF